MGTAAGFGVIILLMLNIDKLKSFKGLGIEAKMKEVDNLIYEGTEIIENLKNMAISISEPIE